MVGGIVADFTQRQHGCRELFSSAVERVDDRRGIRGRGRGATVEAVKIVSLLPSATEILFDLGLGDQVVGVTFECDFPPEAKTKRIVSTSALPEGLNPAEIDAVVSERMAAGEDLYRLDGDALAELQPDLVITQDLCSVCAVDVSDVSEALDYLGCRADVINLDPMTLSEVIDSVALVAAATGTERRGAELTAGLWARLDVVGERLGATADTDRPSTLVLEWTEPAFTGGHWVPEMVERAGGRAVHGFAGTHSRAVPWATLDADPVDVAFVAPCGFRLDGAAELGTDTLAAGHLGRAERVWALDADAHVVRPGPRVVDGVEVMAAVLHPGQFGSPAPDRARRLR